MTLSQQGSSCLSLFRVIKHGSPRNSLQRVRIYFVQAQPLNLTLQLESLKEHTIRVFDPTHWKQYISRMTAEAYGGRAFGWGDIYISVRCRIRDLKPVGFGLTGHRLSPKGRGAPGVSAERSEDS